MTLDPYSPGYGNFNFRPYRNAFMFLGVNRTWETKWSCVITVQAQREHLMSRSPYFWVSHRVWGSLLRGPWSPYLGHTKQPASLKLFHLLN